MDVSVSSCHNARLHSGSDAILLSRETTMITFDSGSYKFTLRAAAIAYRGEHILLHRLDRDDYWALPGGRVEPGESAGETVVRELFEEIGVVATCGDLRLVIENYFREPGKLHHEVGLYHAVSLDARSELMTADGPYRGREGSHELVFDWFPCARLADVALRPFPLRTALADRSAQLRHVVYRDAPQENTIDTNT